MSGARIGGIDLNLLTPLHALLTEKNVSYAANKVQMSQPAMSGALSRLREYFDDELLVRSGKGYELTSFSEILLPEVIEALWTPMLKYTKDQQTGEADMTKAPTLKVKLPCWEGKFNCEIYDPQGTMLYPDESSASSPLELIPKGVNIVAIIQCGGLWFANGKFGCTWRLFQAVVQPKPSMKGKCLISVSPAAKTVLVAASAANETGMVIEDDDSDCEAEPEFEAPPPPQVKAPQPTKPVPVPQPPPQVVAEPQPEPAVVVAPVEVAVAAAATISVKKKIVRKKE